ncbi:CDP-2,3-bis-(O-geranylgeranyl)-sn-glycerol synthase [Methanococcus voltae]|uniref:CDP-archaeol synthase n=1 Tax=Methanococcus voltae (strain ATCC BAA-1334 / A3) TaxID=456320 RepID=D7DUV5_METV3|nr:CDP-2,3-bis-(O-geranylgeranyl)-sn-glycerol synthase [Methanococcus voltae]MCS3900717.1 CDP-2,3-bis-(O-geranylgeranyl)-sn-glycerol synthase [Methanococcus voltae]
MDYYIFLLLSSVWYIIPAYIANATACVFGGGTPIDGGKKFIDGHRLIGNGVTIKGTLSGILCGVVASIIQYFIGNYFNSSWMILDFGLLQYIVLGLFLSTGALFGDLFGSFVKRRVNISQGGSAPLWDQLTFIVFALIFGYLYLPVSYDMAILLIILSPIIHLLSNIIAYKLGIKKVWW